MLFALVLHKKEDDTRQPDVQFLMQFIPFCLVVYFLLGFLIKMRLDGKCASKQMRAANFCAQDQLLSIRRNPQDRAANLGVSYSGDKFVSPKVAVRKLESAHSIIFSLPIRLAKLAELCGHCVGCVTFKRIYINLI